MAETLMAMPGLILDQVVGLIVMVITRINILVSCN
eukprot:CAMPEP_0176357882 /NCGR_PEP_ID=MMETSP0126-20121128/15115_1 /TAXON_ID=141414 ORGANISM="Strombidinopsis acuminatum, Strain SPMC142" /NCGR_SAMPLE_ID=MMETSP0126 /ASSEMBLY_ACC=CAM_ASM_000229 /LENGTH=34 /DNA_ID= /DNA_START= /DNA_END= /DNA_ORIENTATION=